MKKILIAASLMLFTATAAFSQKIAVSTNVATWAVAGPNLGLEFGLGGHTSINVTGAYAPYSMWSNLDLKDSWGIQSELRWWPCERFNGHFFGLHGLYSDYNATVMDRRYDGWMAGAGISYGYQWILSRRWNFEAEIGAGYAYKEYQKWDANTGGLFGNEKKDYFGPTRLSLSFIYFIN